MWKTDRRGALEERPGRRQLVDELIDAYVGWREECGALRLSYGRWHASVRRERRLAFAAYVAALDREERAATVYRSFLDRAAAAGAAGFPSGPDWPSELLAGAFDT
jgi:hypothetical protein